MQVESFSIASTLPLGGVDNSSGRANGSPNSGPPLPGSGKTRLPLESHDSLEKAIGSIQEAIKDANITLEFSRDEESGAIVVKLVDSVSGEAIDQIPSETALHIAASLGKLQGKLFNRTA